MTLTTEQLREIAEKIDSPPSNITTRVMAEMARELLANREAQPTEWSGWACQFPGHIPRLYGDKAIAEINCDYAGGQQLLFLSSSPPAPAARIAGYFVRQRPKWDERAPWTPWKEVDEASYDDFVKIIATGEAYCGWFYDTRILYTAPPAPTLPAELLDAVDEVIRISDRDHDAWARAKEAITACRAAMLAAAPEESSD